MPYSKTWKDAGFKRGIDYSFGMFTKEQVKQIRKRFLGFCNSDWVRFI